MTGSSAFGATGIPNSTLLIACILLALAFSWVLKPCSFSTTSPPVSVCKSTSQ